MTVVTLRSEGGDGPVWFEMVADARGVASVSRDGVVVVTSVLEERETATMTMVAGDSSPENRTMVTMTVVFSFPLSLAEDVATFVAAEGFRGAVFSVTAMGGFGMYSYAWVRGDEGLAVDAAGVLSVVAPLPAETVMRAVFAVTDEADGDARFTLRVRFVGAGAFGGGNLYLVGGTAGERHDQYLDDVWRSADGAVWEQVRTAGDVFTGRSGHGVVSYGGSLWVLGGGFHNTRTVEIFEGDVWASADGVRWGAVADDAFPGRVNHQAVSHRGSLWIIGGRNKAGSPYLSDVWRSADGRSWAPVAALTGVYREEYDEETGNFYTYRWNKFSGLQDHAAVSHLGYLWVIGGQGNDGSYNSFVRRSEDGAGWVQTSWALFSGRGGHAAVSYGGSLWVIGGQDSLGYRNDVWRSVYGVYWDKVAVTGSVFSGRRGHDVVSYGGSLWVIGGQDDDEQFDDVWRSADGAHWELVTADGDVFSKRRGHGAVSFGPSFVYRDQPIMVTLPGALRVSSVDALPLTLTTLQASGGDGALRFEMVADARGVVSVSTDGVLVATNFIGYGETATATIGVEDSAPVGNGAMVTITVAFDSPLSVTRSRGRYVVSPGFTGAVHSLSVSGGFGGYSYARAAGDAALTIGAAGVVSVVTPLAGTRVSAVFAVTDEADGDVRVTVEVRVAAVGDFAGEEWLYLVGGTDGSGYLNDVWRSMNGKDWVSLTVSRAFAGRQDHRMASFGGSLWVVGGHVRVNGRDEYFDDVWQSVDGINWVSVSVAGDGFPARSGHQLVAYDGNLWVIGGVDRSTRFRDVWRSADGITWVSLNLFIPSFPGRSEHQAVSYGVSLWVFGGTNGGERFGDVWRSEGGTIWWDASLAAFSTRNGHQMAVHRGSLWLVGGFHDDDTRADYLGDVWRSADGVAWTRSATIPKRQYHQMAVYRGSLWVAGGFNGSALGDVWRSADGITWVSLTVTAPSFSARSGHQMVAHSVVSFVHPVVDVVATPPEGTLLVSSADALPLTLATLQASGGNGGLTFEATEAKEGVSVAADGVVVATSFRGEGVRTRVAVRVEDAMGVNQTTMMVTVAYFVPLTVSVQSAEYLVSPLYAGSVHAAAVGSGFGVYSFSRVAGDAALTVGADGVVSVTTPLAAGGRAAAVFAATDEAGGSVRFAVSVRAAATKGAYGSEYLYVVGGVDRLARGDVWRSRDGVSWEQLHSSSPFGVRLGHQVVSYRGNLWLVGGTDSILGVGPLGDLGGGGEGDLDPLEGVLGQQDFGGFGGEVPKVNHLNDVWRSVDGVSWTPVPVSLPSFLGRANHQVVFYGGSLWLAGGYDGESFGDVWRSADGASWTPVDVGNPSFAGRYGHQMVAYGGSLWVVGGRGDDGFLGDVWRSANGADWVSVTVASPRFSARNNHEAVSYGGSLWVIGGWGDDGVLGDVWRSANGSVWVSVTVATPQFSARRAHQVVSYRGSLWLLAGNDGQNTQAGFIQSGELVYGNRGQVWRSANGSVWVSVAVDAPSFSARDEHQVVAHSTPFVYEVNPIAAAGPTGVVTVLAYSETPATLATLATLRATGGATTPRFELAADASGGMSVGATSGVLMMTLLPPFGEFATVTIRVGDGTPLNATTLTVTMYHVPPISVSPKSAEFVVSRNYVGVMVTMTAMGGRGDYSYSAVGAEGLSVDVETGVISLVRPLGAGGSRRAVFVAQDEIGRTARFVLSVRVPAEGVYGSGERLYLVGGLAKNGARTLDDKRWSENGRDWRVLGAAEAFGRRFGHQVVSHGGSLWLLGGFDGFAQDNEVWRSLDGRGWVELSASSPAQRFSARSGHQAVSHRGSLWVLGGSVDQSRRDIWRSADGKDWVGVSVVSPWFENRSFHQAVSYGGSLWVMGGHDDANNYGDVWQSANGVNWKRVLDNDFWARHSHQLLVHEGSLWVLGGTDGNKFFNDVWRSADGVVWTSVTVSGQVFSPRKGHQAFSYRGSLWVMGGNDGDRDGEDFDDVWRSADGTVWVRVTDGATNVPSDDRGRQYHQVAAHSVPFVYEVAAVSARGPDVTIWVSPRGGTLPVRVATITASGGSGARRFEVADAQTVAAVAADGVLMVTQFLKEGERATVTVVARDATPVNSASVTVTMVFVERLSLATGAAAYVVSPGFTGAVHSLAVVAGFGTLSYARVEGDRALTVRAGTLLVATPLAAGERVRAVFEVRDAAGGDGRFTLSVQASGTGAYGSGEWLYLVGGLDRDGRRLGDVWRSMDGMAWEAVAARAFVGREGHEAVSYGGSLWVLGGYDGTVRFDDVWRSADGARWEPVTAAGQRFSARQFHQAVSYGGRLWVVGGVDGTGSLGDSWWSTDGVRWTLETPAGEGRLPGRFGHQAVSYGGSLLVIGGFGGGRLDDVWSSANGGDWDLVAGVGDRFSARFNHQAVVHGGSVWVIGGNDGGQLADVWRSADGAGWEPVAVVGDAFSGRAGHRAVSWRGSLWVVGGNDGTAPLG